MDTLEKTGADIDGIMERFLGDEALYADCFKAFMQDDNFEALGKALATRNYRQAFECAHALKGVAGNLGLLPLYRIAGDLVDALRVKNYDGLELLYRDTMAHRAALAALLQ